MTRNTKLYNAWANMKARCYVPSAKQYADYGGRGITVCDEWRASFSAFKQWAEANGFEPHLTIERRNNSLGYSPDNCRWATRSEQRYNTRKRRSCSSKYRGVCWLKDKQRWRAKLKIGARNVYLGSFTSQLAAALAYDDAAVMNLGEFVLLNFPERFRATAAHVASLTAIQESSISTNP